MSTSQSAWVQAVKRLVVVFVCGGIAAILATNFAPLENVLGAYQPLVVPILTAVLQGILKVLGGPTVTLARGVSSALSAGPTPPWWAV